MPDRTAVNEQEMSTQAMHALFDLDGKVAVVTGAARGIGREYAGGLAGAGASVVLADVLDDEGAEAAEAIAATGSKAMYLHADVTDEGSLREAADAVEERFGRVDILVNNAALYAGLSFVDTLELPQSRWNRVMEVNVTGTWLASRTFAPLMARTGGGTIINQSSGAAWLGGPNFSDYCTSKGAVNALTRALARDFGPLNVRVNAISPGAIGTQSTLDLRNSDLADFDASAVGRQIIQRPGRAADLVGPMLFLAGGASSWMTGQVISIDGGWFLIGG